MLTIGSNHGGPVEEDMLQIYLQLLMVTASKSGNYPEPDTVSDEYKHINEFFQLLENEVSGINYTAPIQAKTAQEFADKLLIHPNHLNALLKKHTGKNVSTHIKTKLLEESKSCWRKPIGACSRLVMQLALLISPILASSLKKMRVLHLRSSERTTLS